MTHNFEQMTVVYIRSITCSAEPLLEGLAPWLYFSRIMKELVHLPCNILAASVWDLKAQPGLPKISDALCVNREHLFNLWPRQQQSVLHFSQSTPTYA